MKRLKKKSRPQIFFVDSDPKICKIAKKTLEQIRATVKCFDNGSECLTQLLSKRCDLLIIDMQMPGRSGIGLLVEAKRIVRKMPVLMVTDYADSATASAAMKAGAEYVVEKPVYEKNFMLKVRSLLNKTTSANPTKCDNSSDSRVHCSEQKHALREQILDVATKLFSDSGFHLTTIRKIAKQAHCNVAAVNYHFHGKENLYVEVFHRQMKLLSGQRINRIEQELLGPEFQMDIESLIRSFAKIFLDRPNS